jgi:hypothetical protein
MLINAETLQMRISRLNRRIAERSDIPEETPEEIKHILKTAPRMLRDIEGAVRQNDYSTFGQIHEVLNRAETNIEWAIGTVHGIITDQRFKSGKVADPSSSTDKRLLDRITRYLLTKINGPAYISLVREFAGEDAVQGNTIHMDPVEESEAFSQWMIFDIKPPGESQRIIDLFAKTELTKLPPDEQDLLKVRLADRPSIYKVVKLGGDQETPTDTYLVQDLLSPDHIIRIHDKSTSKSLQPGSIFMGRVIPVISSDNLFHVMGAISAYPVKLWSILSVAVDKWSREFFEVNPNANIQDFFRSHHSRLRREIRTIVAAHSRR